MQKKYFFLLTLLLSLTACKNDNKDDTSNYLDYEDIQLDKKWGYNDLNRFENGIKLKEFYEAINNKYEAFEKSEKDLEKTSITTSSKTIETYYIIDNVNYSSYQLSEYEAISVVKTYSYDHPRYFWIGNDILSNDKEIALTCEENYHLSKDRIEKNKKIDDYVLNLQKKLPKDSNEDEIIDIIHNYVLNTASYGYPLDEYNYIDTHTIIGITNYGLGVCESYAKTFQYLLNIFGIDAIFACGNILNSDNQLESHAWNLVKRNNSWYLIDPTWDDSEELRKDYYKTKKKIENKYFPDQNTDLIYAEYFNYLLPEIKE